MIEYHKIYGPFRRYTEGPNKNKLRWWEWYSDWFDALRDVQWDWTEKVDGTNVRVHWDGHKVEIAGRTANAQLHVDLIKKVDSMFPEELMEQTFQDKKVTLYGEGYGAGIQKRGVQYSSGKNFILFDVLFHGTDGFKSDLWSARDTVTEIGDSLGIASVPYIDRLSLVDAIHVMQQEGAESFLLEHAEEEGLFAEGWVGTPVGGLRDRFGGRIIVKLKHEDLYGM